MIFPANLSPVEVLSLQRSVKSAVEFVETKNEGHFESSFEILLDNRPAFHNGLATVIPRNFIWVHSVPPQNNSSIGYSQDYIQSTLVHEMGHMFYLQKRRGIFRTGGWFFGNLSSPLGAWPRWMHEGWATWTEGRFAQGQNEAYLNFLKRTYSEFVAENPEYRLTNSMLEGSSPLQLTESGEIPYAFGSNMLQKIFLKLKPEEWAQSSASSLGISFRKNAGRNGFSMQEIFEQTENEWRSEPTVSVANAKDVSEVYTASSLEALSGSVAIERNEKQTLVIDFSDHKKIRRLPWRHHNWYLASVTKTRDPNVFVAAYYSSPRTGRAGTRLRIGRFETDQSYKSLVHMCTVFESDAASIESLRTDTAGQTIATFYSRVPGQSAESMLSTLSLGDGCAPVDIAAVTTPILSQAPFDTEVWLLRESDKITWKLASLINPQIEPNAVCETAFATKVKLCLSAIQSTPAARNPAVITQTTSGLWLQKTQPVTTGAQDKHLDSEGIAWIEKHWEDDRLQHLPLGALINIKAQPWAGAQKQNPPTNKTTAPESAPNAALTTNYSPLSSMWPHYWMPRLYATQGGVIVSGTTWFHDITKTYEGSLDLGYDTVSRAPYVQTGLQKKIGDTAWPQSVDASFSYLRDTTLGFNLDQGALQMGTSGSIPIGGSNSFLPRVFATGKWTSINGDRKYFLIPALSLAWQYRQATSPTSLNIDHSDHALGLLVYGRTSWINNYEVYAETALSHSWPMSWVLHFEYGNTSRKNLPYSYFEWGGSYPLSLSQPAFLSRGFAPRMAASTNIARAAFTTGWTWTDRIGGLGWSRFEIERLSQDLFFESVSFESLSSNRSQLGKNFYSSVGTELNFWLRSLFYLKSRCFLGVYQGFGRYGETRFGVGLASNLDI